jgi:hypothetical protein
MQMISGKIIFFFRVCLRSRNMLRKIFYIVYLEQCKTKQQKKPTPKTTGIHQKWEPPLLAIATHLEIHLATHHCQPPKSQQKPVGHRLMREIREAVVLRCACEAVVLRFEIGAVRSRGAVVRDQREGGWVLFEIGAEGGFLFEIGIGVAAV